MTGTRRWYFADQLGPHFLDRNRDALRANRRMKPILANLDRLTDLADVRRQERWRGTSSP